MTDVDTQGTFGQKKLF